MSLRHTESDENGGSGAGGPKTGATLESIPWKCLAFGIVIFERVASVDLIGWRYEIHAATTVLEALVRADRDRDLRPLVFAVFLESAEYQGADGGTRAVCASHLRLALDASLWPRGLSASAGRSEAQILYLAHG
jgi:hypothetical protein